MVDLDIKDDGDYDFELNQDVQEKDESFERKLTGKATQLFGDYYQQQIKDGNFGFVKAKLREEEADIYLSKITLYSMAAGIIGLLLAGLLGVVLIASGALLSVETGIRYPEPIAIVLWTLKTNIIGSVVIGIIGLLLFTVGTYIIGLIYPTMVAGRRKSKINETLPFAITFMYALSRGGMSFIEVLRELAQSEDAYGEVAREIQPLVADMDMFSNDMPTALHRAAKRSPSDDLADFFDDLQSTLDAGSDITRFLDDKSQEYLEKARRDQKNFISTLELMGEVYVTVFVAGPLFLIIISVVMSMLSGGGGAIRQLYGIVYGLLPFMNVGFYLLIDFLSGSSSEVADRLDEKNIRHVPDEQLEEWKEEDGDVFDKILKNRKKEGRRAFIRHPIEKMIKNPHYSFIFSVPLALIAFIFFAISGLGVFSFQAYVDAPVVNTFFTFTAPLFMMIAPYSILYEMKARRQSSMMSRIPDALGQLASSNAVGMSLTESLKTVSANTGGELGKELNMVSNDITWNHDVNRALVNFANRVKMPIVTRTMKLVTKANESSGDIEDVLDVASEDVSERQKLEKQQAQAMMMYTVIILISYAVYLFVIAMLDATFLQRIAELGGGGGGGGLNTGGGSGGGGGFGAAGNISDLPVDQFRMIFYHSTVIQGLGSGILAGKLGSDDALKGLKFSIILTSISSVMFYFLA